MKLPGSLKSKIAVLITLIVFGLPCFFALMDRLDCEQRAEDAQVVYLQTYHDWRVTHPEQQMIGVIYLAPEGLVKAVNRWRQFLPPCGPVPQDKWIAL